MWIIVNIRLIIEFFGCYWMDSSEWFIFVNNSSTRVVKGSRCQPVYTPDFKNAIISSSVAWWWSNFNAWCLFCPKSLITFESSRTSIFLELLGWVSWGPIRSSALSRVTLFQGVNCSISMKIKNKNSLWRRSP